MIWAWRKLISKALIGVATKLVHLLWLPERCVVSVPPLSGEPMCGAKTKQKHNLLGFPLPFVVQELGLSCKPAWLSDKQPSEGLGLLVFCHCKSGLSVYLRWLPERCVVSILLPTWISSCGYKRTRTKQFGVVFDPSHCALSCCTVRHPLVERPKIKIGG